MFHRFMILSCKVNKNSAKNDIFLFAITLHFVFFMLLHSMYVFLYQ